MLGAIALRRLAPLAVALVTASAAWAIFLPHSPGQLRELVASAGAVAPLAAICAWLVLTPALVSGAVLAAASGLAFGALGGAAVAWAGAIVGGLAAFALARTVAREPAQRGLRRLRRADRLMSLLKRRGFVAVLAARLMPGVPSTALHYAAGISPVKVTAFAAAIGLGAALRTVPYALLGEGIGSGSLEAFVVAAGSIVVGGGCALVLVWRLRVAPVPG
jgi:uncharacterized membrane protein YdjX (TVP38/TMEM64 family)